MREAGRGDPQEWDKGDMDDLNRAKARGDAHPGTLRAEYTEASKDDKAAKSWATWCEEFVGRTDRMCRLYVQIATGWEKVKDCTSISEAKKRLTKPTGPKDTTDKAGKADGTAGTEPSVPTLTDDDKQRLTASLSASGIKGLPDAVLAAVARAGFKIVRDTTVGTAARREGRAR